VQDTSIGLYQSPQYELLALSSQGLREFDASQRSDPNAISYFSNRSVFVKLKPANALVLLDHQVADRREENRADAESNLEFQSAYQTQSTSVSLQSLSGVYKAGARAVTVKSSEIESGSQKFETGYFALSPKWSWNQQELAAGVRASSGSGITSVNSQLSWSKWLDPREKRIELMVRNFELLPSVYQKFSAFGDSRLRAESNSAIDLVVSQVAGFGRYELMASAWQSKNSIQFDSSLFRYANAGSVNAQSASARLQSLNSDTEISAIVIQPSSTENYLNKPLRVLAAEWAYYGDWSLRLEAEGQTKSTTGELRTLPVRHRLDYQYRIDLLRSRALDLRINNLTQSYRAISANERDTGRRFEVSFSAQF